MTVAVDGPLRDSPLNRRVEHNNIKIANIVLSLFLLSPTDWYVIFKKQDGDNEFILYA